MKLLRDFKCSVCDDTVERYVDSETVEIPCKCGETAHRIIGMPTVALDGTDPAFPSAWDKWARTREQNHKHSAKRNQK